MRNNGKPGKSSAKPLFLGLLIGGLAGAVGMYLYKSGDGAPTPGRTPANGPPVARQAPAMPPMPTRDAKDFNFYGVLEHAPVAPTPQEDTLEATAEAEPANAVPSEIKPFLLQLASFTAEADAEALKARIALAGLTVNVVASEVPGRGMRYRVRVGPLASQEEMTHAKARMRQAGVEVGQAFVVR